MTFLSRTTAATVMAFVFASPAVAQYRQVGRGHGRIGHVGHGHVGHVGHGHLWHGHGHSNYRHNHVGYYSYGYPGSSIGLYVQPAYAATAAVVPSVVAAGYSVPSANSAQLQVYVPDADAQVWLEGRLTATRGMTRVYESPPLEAGKSFTYTIRASWSQEGRTVTEERQVEVMAGRLSAVDFLQQPPPEKIPAPIKRGASLPER